MNNKGTKSVAYAVELMEFALATLLKWANEYGLSLNLLTTELIFTRKYKTPDFNLPRLDGITLKLLKEVKYLGVTLDTKLSWKPDAESRVQKALYAF